MTDFPALSTLFPFGDKGLSYDQLLVDPLVRAHGTRVMQTVGTAVDGLDDIDLLVPKLKELATRHIAYGVTKQPHFSARQALAGATLHAQVEEGLGKEVRRTHKIRRTAVHQGWTTYPCIYESQTFLELLLRVLTNIQARRTGSTFGMEEGQEWKRAWWMMFERKFESHERLRLLQ